jgi:hypothetical protein
VREGKNTHRHIHTKEKNKGKTKGKRKQRGKKDKRNKKERRNVSSTLVQPSSMDLGGGGGQGLTQVRNF